MHDPIKTITKFGLSITSQTTAVLDIKYEAPFINWNKDQFVEAIVDLLGSAPKCELTSLHDAKYTMMYFVQNLILHELKNEAVDTNSVFDFSLRQSRKFQEQNKLALSLEPGFMSESADGITHRTGTKSEQAYQIYSEHIDEENARATIIRLFQTELDMSKGGSTTYFHNTKKRYNTNQ